MNGSSYLAPFREIRNPSSQKVVFIVTVDDPGMICSNARPDGKGLKMFSSTKGPIGPGKKTLTNVESSGFVVSIRSVRPSTPTVPTISALVTIIDEDIPFNVVTFTLLMSLPPVVVVEVVVPPPDDGDDDDDDSWMVCVAGPTSLRGAGIASVILKIWSA